jgi:periplasmic protein TonB
MKHFTIVACMATFLVGGLTVGPAIGAETAPVAIKEVKPQYPKDALKKKRQGTVLIAVEVKTDGTVGNARVTQPLSPTLDAEALKAAKQWRFKPGTKDGKAVPVETTLEMTFKAR